LQYFSWTSFLLSTNFQIPFFQPIVVWFPLYNKSLLPITCTINERVVVAVAITMVQAKYNWSQLIMSYKKKKKKLSNISTFFKQPTTTNIHFFQDSSFHDHPGHAWMNLLQENSLKPYYLITLFLHHEFYEGTKNVCKSAQ
jgi:hypothetical protein